MAWHQATCRAPRLGIQVLWAFKSLSPCLSIRDRAAPLPHQLSAVVHWIQSQCSFLCSCSQRSRPVIACPSSHFTSKTTDRPSVQGISVQHLANISWNAWSRGASCSAATQSVRHEPQPDQSNAVWLSGPARPVRHAFGLASGCAEISQRAGIFRSSLP